MMWEVLRADARRLPLADGSVDLIVTSPPYWGLRSYRDGGEHYSGQVGSETTPQQYVDELVGMIDSEWRRVLKPCGSLWLNLGDKYASAGFSGPPGKTTGVSPGHNSARESRRGQPTSEARPKSLLGLPWRVALALIDRGWILRAEVIWSKPNGLPESVTDRVRRSHETWFHLTLEGSYFSAVDEIREPHMTAMAWQSNDGKRGASTRQDNDRAHIPLTGEQSALGRLPGSVRTVPTQPLIIPDAVKASLGLVDHFAAFPMEWPRWIIQGWSPREVCGVCGEGRKPVSDVTRENRSSQALAGNPPPDTEWANDQVRDDHDIRSGPSTTRTIVGYACACPDTTAPAMPGVILDPFGGTGTTAGVAHMLGRHGISVDLSADYCRLAQWRIAESGDFQRFMFGQRPVAQIAGQGGLFDQEDGDV